MPTPRSRIKRLVVGKYLSKGYHSEIFYVDSVKGDFKSPNAHSYKSFIGSYTKPYESTGWYGYTGEIVGYTSTNGVVSGLSSPSETGWVLSKDPLVTYPWDDVNDRAMAKVFSKLRGNSELFVDFSERSSTLKMVKSALLLKRKMISFAKEIAGGRRRSIKEISNLWLEYRYGWMPLVHSIYDAVDNTLREYQNTTMLVKGRSSWKDYVHDYTVTEGALGSRKAIRKYNEYSCRTELGLTFMPPPLSQQMIQNWTSVNPLSTAWELLPFSFVADWFVNVGDQLRAWENWAMYYQYFSGGYRTQVIHEVRAADFFDGIPEPVPEYRNGYLVQKAYGSRTDFGCTSKLVKFDRILVLNLPTPSGFRFKVDLNAKRLTDAAALASGAWKQMSRGGVKR